MADSRVIADATTSNWVDRWAPEGLRPLLKLGRLDRPIGAWLLLWPCFWGISLATPFGEYPDFLLLVLFTIGAFAMRSAGCAFNDIVDRDVDKQVERTAKRPLASGQLSLREGIMFLGLLGLLGLLVLQQLNLFTILLGFFSLILVGIYPFMKRVTYWPQLFLGLTFNWGVLMGWAAVAGGLSLEALYLYIAGIFWTLGYDTIYAHMDKNDDILVGVKSTALKFGENTRAWLFLFYGLSLGFFILAGIENDLNRVYYLGVIAVFFHYKNQISTLNIHDGDNCLKTFQSNMYVGVIVFLSIVASKIIVF